MVIEARKLCGDHVGTGILVEIITEDGRSWDEENRKWVGDVKYGKEFTPISMITHKKNGDVNVRTGYGERRYEADSLVKLQD